MHLWRIRGRSKQPDTGKGRSALGAGRLFCCVRLLYATGWTVTRTIKWILHKFADSWNGSGEAENAPLLTKQIDTFSTVELLFNISKLA